MAEDLVREGQRLIEGARVREQQLALLEPVSPEEMQRARVELGPKAGELTVLEHARKGRGRPKGARNRRTEDFRRYVLQFGRHPALTMMEIQNTPAEVLMERSKALDVPKNRLSYNAAQALRLRAAEGLMPFIESKQPVAVELSADGDFNLIIPGFNVSQDDADKMAAGEFVLDADFDDVDEGGGE